MMTFKEFCKKKYPNWLVSKNKPKPKEAQK